MKGLVYRLQWTEKYPEKNSTKLKVLPCLRTMSSRSEGCIDSRPQHQMEVSGQLHAPTVTPMNRESSNH